MPSSPYINRFLQPDTVIPNAANPQTWNHYGYAINNPILYNDPDGHCGLLCVAVIFVVGSLVLAGDTPVPPPTLNPAVNTVKQIRHYSSTSGDALVNLFTTTALPGNSPEERFNVVLKATETGCRQSFPAGYDDSGFTDEYKDSELYPGSSNQVGHFLTAASLAYGAGDSEANQYLALSLITGHEMEGDLGVTFAQHVVQASLGLVNPEAHNAFLNGTDDDFNYILGRGTKNRTRRYGNSIQDLRLSRLGWEFGRKMFEKEFGSLNDVGDWLSGNLLE